MAIKIIGSGSFIPKKRMPNSLFEENAFYDHNGNLIPQDNKTIIRKFKAITGIEERRYVEDSINNSDIGYFAAKTCIEDAQINKEDLDYIIVAHNYGDVYPNSMQCDTVPSVASRIKQKLDIKNPKCVAYDILFGCPGWVEAMIQANAFIKSGIAKRCLVIGTETLSRVVDKHNRDCMIFSDGAGAVIIEETADNGGIIAHETATFALDEAFYINYEASTNPKLDRNNRYINMQGRKIYEFALTQVPVAMKAALEKAQVDINQLKKILIHQANEKMDEAIVNRFYKLYQLDVPNNIMPMTIGMFGNSSVATVPTLYDLISKGKLDDHQFEKDDVILLASVGAGMNINAIVYQV